MARKLLASVIYRSGFIRRILEIVLNRIQFVLLGFYEDEATIALLKQTYRETSLLMQPLEAFMIHGLAAMQSNIDGAMAEVGTYRGGSAKLICSVKKDRPFFGFDTFEGLPEVSRHDTHWGVRWFHARQFAADQAEVARYLEPFPGVHLIKGRFPDGTGALEGLSFSFVHLDTDLYESTRDGLAFFWDRMTPRGIIVVHDSHAAGVRKAIDEFVARSQPLGFSSVGSQHVFVK